MGTDRNGVYRGALAVSVAIVAVLVSTGLLYFRRMERTFADVI